VAALFREILMHLPVRAILAALAMAGPVPALANGTADRPPVPDWQTDAACTWEWREGGGIGLWTERCALSTGLWEVVWREEAGAFVQEAGGAEMGIVVQPFAFDPADPEPLRLRLLEAGGLGADAPCAFEGAAVRPAPRTVGFLVLMPTVPDAFAPTATGDVPDPLCGPYGASTHGVRYIVTDLRWPGVAVFVEEGQERPMFDPASLTAVTGG
jgi:hypothetical protein